MANIAFELLLFLGKALILLLFFGVAIALVAKVRASSRKNTVHSGGMRVVNYSRHVLNHASTLRQATNAIGLPDRTRASLAPATNAAFLLVISDEALAGRLTALKLEVNAILLTANADDIVVVRVKSTGGIISLFGAAAAQIERLRARGLRVVASIDEMAVSGGYMIAAVADEIIATSFANVGGIGLITTKVNFSSALQRFGVKYLVANAGEDKLSINAFSSDTDRALRQQTEHLEDGLSIWRSQLSRYRPRIDANAVSTGRVWFGADAVSLGLVDRIQAFDDFMLSNLDRYHFIWVNLEVGSRNSGFVNKLIRLARKFS